jgi:mechanosensitive ion channel-like protein
MAGKALEMLVGKLSGWLQQFILLLPNLAIAVMVVIVFWLLARLAKNLSLQLLDRALEKKAEVRRTRSLLEGSRQILKTVRVVEIDLGHGEQKRSVTQGTARAARILRALGVSHLDPDGETKSRKIA